MKNCIKHLNKIFFLFAFCSMLCLCGCSNEDIFNMGITEKEHSLNLIAPSGERIADNIASIKNETALIVAETYGIDKVFEITKLNYLQAKKGYVVIIEYETEDGLNGSYAMSKDAEINYSLDKAVLKSLKTRLRSATESGNGGSTKFVCKASGKCDSCKLEGSYDPNTGVNTITCSCDDCEMEITTS